MASRGGLRLLTLVLAHVLVLVFVAAVTAACSTTEATPSAPPVAPVTTCACSGVVVDEGTVDAACGASVCLGQTGYRCAADGLTAEPDPDACPRKGSAGSGGKTGSYTATLPFEGAPRLYAAHVPEAYTTERPVPLVLHFHGWRPAPAGVDDEIDHVWKKTAGENGFIVVAPEGASCPELNPKGDPFLCFDEQRDDAWLQTLLTTLKGQYNIDLDRIFLSGHSGGAFFVQGYGLLHTKEFRAVATFSGGCIAASDKYGNSCSVYAGLAKAAKRKIPYHLMHNPDDGVVPDTYSADMAKVLTDAGFKTQTYFKKYKGGSNGHSIDVSLVPSVWKWLWAADAEFVAE